MKTIFFLMSVFLLSALTFPANAALNTEALSVIRSIHAKLETSSDRIDRKKKRKIKKKVRQAGKIYKSVKSDRKDKKKARKVERKIRRVVDIF